MGKKLVVKGITATIKHKVAQYVNSIFIVVKQYLPENRNMKRHTNVPLPKILPLAVLLI